MKLSYFASQLVSKLPSTVKLFKDFARVVKSLEAAHFNQYEIEVILMDTKLVKTALKGVKGLAPYNTLTKYLNTQGITSGCTYLNKRIMKEFGKKDRLEYNEKGQVCRRGTMPGNPGAGTTLVPLGTPAICNPHTETYWSM
jgi:hypothetical protein